MLYIFSMYMYVYTFVCNKDVIHTFTSCHNTSSVHYHLFQGHQIIQARVALKATPSCCLCTFVCLFILVIPELLYFAPCVWMEGINNPWGSLHTDSGTAHVHRSNTAP